MGYTKGQPVEYEPFLVHNGYEWPPTRANYFDFCDRAMCAPDSPHFLHWSPEELSDRYNRNAAAARRGPCTPEIAATMLAVEWG